MAESNTLEEPSADGRTFTIHFDRALVFRVANESYRLKMVESVNHELPLANFQSRKLRIDSMVPRPNVWNLSRLVCITSCL
jgi:hypothetical protein